jgi:hypothetical protein
MLNFDDDVESIDDFLVDLDVEPELTDKKWRFKERVNLLMKRHNRTRSEAEEIVETSIRTKETSKRCACGKVAQYFDPSNKRLIYCGACWMNLHPTDYL